MSRLWSWLTPTPRAGCVLILFVSVGVPYIVLRAVI